MKFKCVESFSPSVKVGDVLFGYETHCGRRFTLTQDSSFVMSTNHPRFQIGTDLPLDGHLWKWEAVE